MCERKCVISLKRQHMWVDDDNTEDDELFSKSITNISANNSVVNGSKDVKVTTPTAASPRSNADSETESESGNESENEPPSLAPCTSINQSDDDEAPGPAHMSTTDNGYAPEVSTRVRETADSPVPGPSGVQTNQAYFEDVTFEPPVTSTPHHGGENGMDVDEVVNQEDGNGEDDQEEDEEDKWDMVRLKDISMKFQEGKEEVKFIKKDFLIDVKSVINLKSKLYLPKLRERRSKFLIELKKLAKHKIKIDNLFKKISSGVKQIDKEIKDFEYFVEHFPEIVEQQQN